MKDTLGNVDTHRSSAALGPPMLDSVGVSEPIGSQNLNLHSGTQSHQPLCQAVPMLLHEVGHALVAHVAKGILLIPVNEKHPCRAPSSPPCKQASKEQSTVRGSHPQQQCAMATEGENERRYLQGKLSTSLGTWRLC